MNKQGKKIQKNESRLRRSRSGHKFIRLAYHVCFFSSLFYFHKKYKSSIYDLHLHKIRCYSFVIPFLFNKYFHVSSAFIPLIILWFFFLYFEQVTWIRHRDLHLLTVDKTTYTSDQRFVSVHNPQLGDWTLQVIK